MHKRLHNNVLQKCETVSLFSKTLQSLPVFLLSSFMTEPMLATASHGKMLNTPQLRGKHYRKFFRESVLCFNWGKNEMKNAASTLISTPQSPLRTSRARAFVIAARRAVKKPATLPNTIPSSEQFGEFWRLLETFGNKNISLDSAPAASLRFREPPTESLI
jgi:hypothetical protein